MAWTIAWSEDALISLADIWVEAVDRRALSEAVQSAEAALKRNPYVASSELSEGLRVTDFPGVRFFVEIDESQSRVEISNVRRRKMPS